MEAGSRRSDRIGAIMVDDSALMNPTSKKMLRYLRSPQSVVRDIVEVACRRYRNKNKYRNMAYCGGANEKAKRVRQIAKGMITVTK